MEVFVKLELEKFLALDSETTMAIKTLESAVDSMSRSEISNAIEANERLRGSLAKNIVRRRDYTSLHRISIQKKRLLDSYIIRHLLINVCVF